MKNLRLSLAKLACTIVALSAQCVFAASNLSIVPLNTVPLPTSVKPGQTVVAYYTVTNNSLTKSQNGLQVQGLPTTAYQDSTGPNYYTNTPICSNPINLAPGGSCLLQIDITGPISQDFAICAAAGCTSSGSTLNVSTDTSTRASLALITQQSLSEPVVACALDPTTGEPTGSCQSAGGGGIFALLQLSTNYQGIMGIKLGNSGSTAYLTIQNSDSSTAPYVLQCPVYANTRMLGTCTATAITSPTGYAPYYGFLTTNSIATIAYIPDNNRILSCPIRSNTIQPNCVNSGAAGISVDPTGIALNPANTAAFIGSYDNYVSTCQVSGSNLGSCTNKTGAGPVTFGEAIGMATDSSGSTLYVADNSNGYVYGCDISSINYSSTTFNSCFVASNLMSPQPWGIALNAGANKAYLTTYSGTFFVCSINSANTPQWNCVSTPLGLSEAVDVAVL